MLVHAPGPPPARISRSWTKPHCCLKVAKRLSVTDLFGGMVSRQEIVCMFLAVLELMKSNQIVAVQEGVFGQIVVEPRQPPKVNRVEDE